MPGEVRDVFGYALFLAQSGLRHLQAKSLSGFGSGGVLEVVEDDNDATFRAVYTIRYENAVYVLHCFQKKSKRGINTPKSDMDLIKQRLKAAELDSRGG